MQNTRLVNEETASKGIHVLVETSIARRIEPTTVLQYLIARPLQRTVAVESFQQNWSTDVFWDLKTQEWHAKGRNPRGLSRKSCQRNIAWAGQVGCVAVAHGHVCSALYFDAFLRTFLSNELLKSEARDLWRPNGGVASKNGQSVWETRRNTKAS